MFWLGLFIGSLLGGVLMAILAVSGDADKMQEIYCNGYNAGGKAAIGKLMISASKINSSFEVKKEGK